MAPGENPPRGDLWVVFLIIALSVIIGTVVAALYSAPAFDEYNGPVRAFGYQDSGTATRSDR